MKTFMDKDFMLQNQTAKHLFHGYAESLPIIDYHCHISPQEICEDRRYENIAQIWLGGRNPDGSCYGDHYKWRLMRSNGVPESAVTGDAEPFEKFLAFAGTLEAAIGNPMYHWSHLELQKYFGIEEPLTRESAKRIWEQTSEMLKNDESLSARGIIRRSNVKFVGTTDDPTDSLEWHEKLAKEDTGFMVRPSFRPDKAVNITKDGFADYIKKLARSVGKESLDTAVEVCDALCKRLDHFAAHGCKASDHGLDYVMFRKGTAEEADAAFRKAMRGEALDKREAEIYQTFVLLRLAREYHARGIVMEIHFSCSRNVNSRMFKAIGPDTGYDMIAKSNCFNELAAFFSELDESGELPRTIVFSLDQNDLNQIATCLGAFQSEEIPGKMQLGAAWWFLDSRDGMEAQMRALGNLGLLGNFVGMLTDSRSLLSYTRHDYFRRIACNLIGRWVEDGEYPNDEKSLKRIVEGISYYNAVRYFGIEL
ncbi:MAG: glucuronate isomerase [Lachnospiraceae bacterium]|nr:glucuronate isomerase [Lachnospiraceae bacterium]